MKKYITLFAKGFGVGAANVIPGVSGGTIALITGIFERLVDSVKSFDLAALKLILKGKFKEFLRHTDFFFLIAVFGGAVVSIFSLARLLGYLFEHYPVFIWAYFFGLILASVYYVGKTVTKFSIPVFISFIVGTAVAIAVSLMNPATENDSFFYLILCGVVGIMSMILPGLSGSFILILMGNYQLVMIDAVNDLNIAVLIPVGIGVVVGLPVFSHVLSWIFKKFKDQTLATLTGFILGSLSILWPWKNPIYLTDDNGIEIFKSNGNPIIKSYERFIPDSVSSEVLIAFAIMLSGILSIWAIEKIAKMSEKKEKTSLTH